MMASPPGHTPAGMPEELELVLLEELVDVEVEPPLPSSKVVTVDVQPYPSAPIAARMDPRSMRLRRVRGVSLG